MARPRIYADETHTGGRAPALRGLGAVTIAAHCSSDDGFEWLERLHHDFFPRTPELKSALVLAEMDASERMRELVLKRIEGAHIVIIDFAEHTKDLFFAIFRAVGTETETLKSVTAFLRTGRLPEDVANKVLRFARLQTLTCSAVGRVEQLLRQAAAVSGVPFGAGDKLFDTDALFKLSESEFKELVARFSIALGESLRPEKQADRIIETLAGHRMAHEGHIAMACLEAASESEAIFDQGSDNAFAMLRDADEKIQQALEHWLCRDGVVRATRLIQEDSRNLRGLQAADIAAGFASQIFEQADTDTLGGAKAVREVFPNVLLNDRWLK